MCRKWLTLCAGVVLASSMASQAELKHRYSFENAAGDATGATVVDLVSGANGTVLGAGASFTGTQLDLPGGPSATAAYVDLPNGMISSLTAVTIEGWVTIDATDQAWARLFDFGTTTQGEHLGPGGGGSGVDYLYLSAAVNLNYNIHRFEMSAGVNNDIFADAGIPTTVGVPYHFLATVENTGDGGMIGRWWKNGVQIVAGDTADVELSAIQDVNNWIGRSNWTGDANVNGTFDEFRIYDHAMTALEAQISYLLGPDDISGNAGAETSRMVTGDDAVVINGTKRFQLELQFANLSEPITFSQDLDLTWSSSDTNIATVSQSGIVTGRGLGTAMISAEFQAGAAAMKSIEVTDRALQHKYSFDEPFAADFEILGLETADSVGGQHATVWGGTLQGDGTVWLQSVFNTEYVELPNGILSQYGAVTVEAWFTPIEDPLSWSRIFSFGNSNQGELGPFDRPGSAGAGQVFFTIDRGGNNPIYSADLNWGGNQSGIVPVFQHGYDALTHIALTFNPGENQVAIYVDGIPYGTAAAPQLLGDLNDVNNWIGRSQWSGDAFMNGTVDEFRIYEGALTAAEVAANVGAGPDGAPFSDPGTPTAGTLRLESDNTSLVVDASVSLVRALAGFSNAIDDLPVNGLDDTVFRSDDTNIVVVSETGLVTPTGPGQTLVWADYAGQSASIQFSVVSIIKPITLVHHWPFDDEPGQTTVMDVVGSAHGTVVGTNHMFTGEALDLFGGGTSATAGTEGNGSYVDLPNGFVSALPGASTFEVAYIRQASGVWQRVYDFGTSDSGTEGVPGLGGENIFLTPQNGANGNIRVAVASGTPGYNFEVQWDDNVERPLGSLVHVVFTYDSDDSVSRLYVNGEMVDVDNAVFALAGIPDINNWIGRAQYSGDPMFSGQINDLKIYTGIMTAAEVEAAYAALTPDEVAIGSAELTAEGLVISWPGDATGFGVEMTTSLSGDPVEWTATGVDPEVVDGQNQVTLPIVEDEAYFRLSE